MLRKFSIVALLTISGWVNTSNAALIGVCTFSGGCGPDFFTSVNADYVYNNGSDSGVLTLTGNVGNASFLAGQLDSTWENTITGGGPDAGDPYGRTSLLVLPSASAGNDALSISFTVDGSGNLIGGTNNITMNGRVVAVDTSLAGNLSTAISYNGTALDGMSVNL